MHVVGGSGATWWAFSSADCIPCGGRTACGHRTVSKMFLGDPASLCSTVVGSKEAKSNSHHGTRLE